MSRRSLLVAVVMCAGCRPSPPLPPPLPPPAASMSDESLPASTRVQLAIVDLREVVSDDKAEVMVSGNIVNWGNRPTTSVTVQVSGLDRDGRVVVQVPVTPGSQIIAPGGGSAPFATLLPNDPAVVDYHVEAVGFGLGTK